MYISLHNFSSVVLHDTARKIKGKFYSVDKIIEKRKLVTIKYKEMLLY